MLANGSSIHVNQRGQHFEGSRTDFSISSILSSKTSPSGKRGIEHQEFLESSSTFDSTNHNSNEYFSPPRRNERPQFLPFLRLAHHVVSLQKSQFQVEIPSNFDSKMFHANGSTFFTHPNRLETILPPCTNSTLSDIVSYQGHNGDSQSVQSSFSLPSSPDAIHRPVPLRPLSGSDYMTANYCHVRSDGSQRILSSSSYSRHKLKRLRTAFSTAQMSVLERTFKTRHYVIGERRKDLAQLLGLSETQSRELAGTCIRTRGGAVIESRINRDTKVKVWFQNRRTKYKKLTQDSNPSYE